MQLCRDKLFPFCLIPMFSLVSLYFYHSVIRVFFRAVWLMCCYALLHVRSFLPL